MLQQCEVDGGGGHSGLNGSQWEPSEAPPSANGSATQVKMFLV